jgi:serine protease Do
MRISRYLALPILFGCLVFPAWADDKPPTVTVEKTSKEPLVKTPANIQELKDIQLRVQDVYKKVLPSVVGIQIGGASGSGVIVSEDGLVLTAGHVSGKPNTNCTVIMPDGKRLKAKSLGQNQGIDSGMIKIEEAGKYPFVEMGDSNGLKKGQWVVALGHPGGFFPGRTPVLRLGRVLDNRNNLIQTDCTLVGGDSGGPLFDLDGKVVGIHSRIGMFITFNIHVPVETYRTTWDRLVAGESWDGSKRTSANRTLPAKGLFEGLGASLELTGGVLKVREVKSGSLAEKAGLKVRDLVMKFDGKTVSNQDEIDAIIKKKKNGDKIVIEVDRGIDRLSLNLEVKN